MRDSRLDDLSTCTDCGKLTEYDPCSGEPHASEGFDRCDCEEVAVSVAVEGLYSPLRDTRLYLGSDEPDCEVA